MNYATPEQKGISSEYILQYIQYLEAHHLSTHDLILMRGEDILFEKYWAPFHKDFLHRMYSVSKGFVSLAIGFLEQDGHICLDDPISKYFPEELAQQPDENMRRQTIRHMLMMSAAKPSQSWFAKRRTDRVRCYFENDEPQSRPSGTIFQYDTSGTFVLCALVERISGKLFMDYLREKLFDFLGVSQEAYCLKCPGGHSWGDSGILCKAGDLLKVARFVMNGGRWNGVQLLSEAYIAAAVSRQIDNNFLNNTAVDGYGYGYQFWRTRDNAYFFNGMGCQFAVCVPDRDLIMVYNGDNQGNPLATQLIIDGFFDFIAVRAGRMPLEEDPQAQACLKTYAENLKLAVADGPLQSDWAEKINGIPYRMEENPMGIMTVCLHFDRETGTGRMTYTNAQGEKELAFGFGENVFGLFPQEGYADLVGGEQTTNHFYRCAASAIWPEPQKLLIKVQIIDCYFGILSISMGFRENQIGIYMCKIAEDFLNEYEGFASGVILSDGGNTA